MSTTNSLPTKDQLAMDATITQQLISLMHETGCDTPESRVALLQHVALGALSAVCVALLQHVALGALSAVCVALGPDYIEAMLPRMREAVVRSASFMDASGGIVQ